VPLGASCGPWRGPGRYRAAVVVRSAKLVHQRLESGEAGRCSWPRSPFLIRSASCWARSCHSVGWPSHSACSLPGACSIHDGSPCANSSLGRKSFAPSQQPLAPAREAAYWHPAMPRSQRVRPDGDDPSAENSSPPLSTRACLARCAKRLGWSVTGLPLPQALICLASGS